MSATLNWTIGETTFVVTATAETILSVRYSFATVASDRARAAFFAGFDGDAEEAFFSAVEASLPVAA